MPSVLNVNTLVGTFNQEKALEGAFSVIMKNDGSFAALVQAQTESPDSLIASQCLSFPNSKLL